MSEEDGSDGAEEYVRRVSRRRFLKLLGAGVLGAGVAYTGVRPLVGTPTGYASDPCDPGSGPSSENGDSTPGSSVVGGGDGGFTWNQTFTDTSWVEAAGDNLNVEKVTTLDPTGPGSITEAFDNAAGQPTVIVFEVGGVIDLGSSEDLSLRSGQTWVAGETAPDPGISITRGRFRIYSSQCIVSHLGVFPGDGTSGESDGLIIDADDVMVDHCTVMWGTDENAGASNAVNRGSFINCICAEALYNSIHPEGQHSRGMLFNEQGTDICVMGCLFAHNNRRNPMSRSDVVLANNYIYNCGGDGELIHFNSPATPDVTSVGLYVEDGPDSQTGNPIHLYSATLYHDDIGQSGNHDITDGSQDVVDSPPILSDGLDLQNGVASSSETKSYVLANAGPRPASRPQVEADLINNRVGDGKGGFVDSQSEVGGYPDYSQTNHTLNVPSTGIIAWLNQKKQAVEGGA